MRVHARGHLGLFLKEVVGVLHFSFVLLASSFLGLLASVSSSCPALLCSLTSPPPEHLLDEG